MPNIQNIPTTQYIGPKIVPHFANPSQWNINTEYDALSIVTNGGNTYWAKYNVPAGIDISNTEYWFLSAYPDSQIQAYRQEVQAYAEQVTGVIDDVADINSDILTINGTIDSIEQTLGNAVDNITAIDSEIININNALAEDAQIIVNNKHYIGPAVAPTIIGTHYGYYDSEFFQGNALCVNNGVVYIGSHNSGDTRSIITAANIQANNFMFTREFSTANIGHFNSMAFDTLRNQFMISANTGYGIVVADPAFNNIMASNLWPFSTWCGRIGFDRITNYGWAIDNGNIQGVTTRKLYVLEPNANQFRFFCNITTPTYNMQDICVRDNKLFMCTTTNEWSLYNINIEAETCEIIQSGVFAPTDGSNIYNLGEMQGCDFDENGYLYAQFTCGPLNVVTNIPFENKYYYPITRATFHVVNATINPSYRNYFKNAIGELKTIGELTVRPHSPRTIIYQGQITEYSGANLHESCAIYINADAEVTFIKELTAIGGIYQLINIGTMIVDGPEFITMYSSATLFTANISSSSTNVFNHTNKRLVYSNQGAGGMSLFFNYPDGYEGRLNSVVPDKKVLYGFGAQRIGGFVQ